MSQSYYSSIANTFQDYAVTYNHRLFNHFPMSIVALERFGASTEQLEAFREYYFERLVHMPSSQSDNQEELNEFAAIEQQTELILSQLERDGIEETLKSSLPALLVGVGAGNFYAINRLAYAVNQNNQNDIAVSLALWETLHLPLGELGETVLKRPTSLLRNVSKCIGHIRFGAGNTTDRMTSVTTLIDYQTTPHQPEVIDFESIANAAATIYKMSGDFTMLHSVTACYSFNQLTKYIEDESLGLRYLWQAIVVAYLSAGSPAMTNVEKPELLPWPEIVEFCCGTHNEHLIELCYACRHLHELSGKEVFHQVAAHYVTLYSEPA
ncbi:questin oxidase family protein [Psychrobium sp. nBUS_13]|uniref:questin oxidase family protein n=1 Tax=Psychrobium sp. nBUS_13 TaxID=3395319 RepID=UPI003EBD6A39